MQLQFIAAALAVFTTGAIAGNCTPGLYYCGRTLMTVGKYQPQIDQAIYDAGKQLLDNGNEDLFYCIGNDNGLIKWSAYCSAGCFNAGHGKSDYCIN
ncbi:hypothetical protein VE03_04687 [Pseudogymnoascus sp. 23342-1-I1]|nr:hypothetical protein VE03_04687 [Pseudogymnoascus sp. 23342-1-I1]